MKDEYTDTHIQYFTDRHRICDNNYMTYTHSNPYKNRPIWVVLQNYY